ncbi:hypothetical protein Barb4_02141 [Bacteroidales bacterium Barb4]|nr:hypothetical protein Barb4_02141 [Bacteroidales bacterium Barb4]
MTTKPFNETFVWKPEKISGRNSIGNQVKKSGYGICKESAHVNSEDEYARITDKRRYLHNIG